jgi:putative DNA primase/helicase
VTVDSRIRFEDVAAAALAQAHILLPEWMGGQRRGREWVAERKANGGLGDSWSVNLTTGKWGSFAGGEHGGDLVSLYAAIHHIDNIAALPIVAAAVGINGSGVPVLPAQMHRQARVARVEPPEEPPEPIPADAPPIRATTAKGVPSAVYYYSTFAVARYDLEKGKTFSQWTWRRNHWINQGPKGDCPLYREAELAKHPDAQVLVVEGEKCADLAAEMLRAFVVISWAGGTGAVPKSDWSPLRDRRVLIWPDADEVGIKAGSQIVEALKGVATQVRVIRPPTSTAVGWDVADAIEEGMNAEQITQFMRENLEGAPKQAPIGELITADERVENENYPAGQVPRSSLVSWQSLGLACNDKNAPHGTFGNASIILQNHEHFLGKIWFDSFRGKIYHSLNGAPQLWTDAQTRSVTAWIQQQMNIPKMHQHLVAEAYQHAAECNTRNSLTDWLDSLKWDGIERLDTWLADCLGLERNEYNDAVSRNWPLSMVARAYQPGCQVDTMPVLEGKMGRGKSSFLKILADPWFAAIPIAFGEKDFFQAIQGRWLIEVPDMTGFSRREHSQILATITNREDVYRKSHGRVTEEHPRVTVFAATSETDDYLQDLRGRRRYWPLRCNEINLDGLHEQRPKIFAEAVLRYRAGAPWYEMPEQANTEQLARSEGDLWSEALVASAEQMWDLQERTGIDSKMTSSRLLEEIGVKIHLQTDSERKRVARVMRETEGWIQSRTSKHRYWMKIKRKE